MKDYQASLEKLRIDAAEAALVRDLATDPVKRAMYSRLHDHLDRLADEVERAMRSGQEGRKAVAVRSVDAREPPAPAAL